MAGRVALAAVLLCAVAAMAMGQSASNVRATYHYYYPTSINWDLYTGASAYTAPLGTAVGRSPGAPSTAGPPSAVLLGPEARHHVASASW
jgi:hypothetical protein